MRRWHVVTSPANVVPLLRWIRGMCADEDPYPEIDAKLVEAIELAYGSSDANAQATDPWTVLELIATSPDARQHGPVWAQDALNARDKETG